jgi:class 3 adenylate cyclase
MSDLLLDILQRAGRLTDSPSGAILLYDNERNGLYFAAATGPKAQGALDKFGEFGPDRVPVQKGDGREYASVAGRVYHTGEPHIIDSVVAESEHFKGVDQGTNHRTESMITVPLLIGGERVGVVQLLNKSTGNYTPRDLELLKHFSAHAAVTLRNARYFQDLLAHQGLFTSGAGGKKTADLLRELNSPAHQERMTIAFADMRGFTRLTQTLGDPHAIEGHLNQFLTLLAKEVIRHEGLVNKFLGDGVLALFRGVGAETRAVRCAFAIIAGFELLRHQWNRSRNEDLSWLDVGVGIATGDVIIGSIGSGRVKDYTALGTSVNLAAAFERQARGDKRVLVDQNTYIAVSDIIAEVGDVDVHELRKEDQPWGIAFRRYNIRRLRPTVGEPSVSARGRVAVGPRPNPDLQGYYNNSWAIVVGVDTYKDSRVPRLAYAVADADAVAGALPRVGFPPEHITVLKNEGASKAGIHQAIYGKLSTTNREDRLLIFFALHGQKLKQHNGEVGYLLPYDTDPLNLPLSALPMAELAQMGKILQPKHILFILDTCFSGHAAKREMLSEDSAADLTLLTQEPAVELLTAGTSGQKAIEEGGNGIFTRHFLKGLEGFANQDGSALTALKLFVYVQERVVNASGNEQTPQFAKLDGEGEFLFLPPRK